MALSEYHTDLKDRRLYFDGESQVTPDRIIDLINQGFSTEQLGVSEISEEIKEFNKLVPPAKRIRVKDGCKPLSFDWNIPEPYKSWQDQEIIDYIIDKWAEDCKSDAVSSEETDQRAQRLSSELWTYRKLNLLPVLRTIIYVINTLREEKVVWGVGRGSSVSSYVLYLIGVHDVDSFKYDLDFSEFLREPDSDRRQ